MVYMPSNICCLLQRAAPAVGIILALLNARDANFGQNQHTKKIEIISYFVIQLFCCINEQLCGCLDPKQ